LGKVAGATKRRATQLGSETGYRETRPLSTPHYPQPQVSIMTTTTNIMEAITSMDLNEVNSEQFETDPDPQIEQTMDILALQDQVKQLKSLLSNERTRVSKQAQAMQANIRQLQGSLTAAELKAVAHEKSAIDANTKLNNMKSMLRIAKNDLKTARTTILHVQNTQKARLEDLVGEDTDAAAA